MSFGKWVCVVDLDVEEHEVVSFVAGVKALFGDRARTTTKARWLVDAERAPVPPMGKVERGTVHTAKLVRKSVGARAQQ